MRAVHIDTYIVLQFCVLVRALLPVVLVGQDLPVQDPAGTLLVPALVRVRVARHRAVQAVAVVNTSYRYKWDWEGVP